MSERLRAAYEKKEEDRIAAIVQHKNRAHLGKMRLAGKMFKLRHPEWYPPKPPRKRTNSTPRTFKVW